jgi:hypothetical protein
MLKWVIGQKQILEGTKAFDRQETRLVCYFWSTSLLQNPDPDPYCPYGSGSRTAKSNQFCKTNSHINPGVSAFHFQFLIMKQAVRTSR